MKRLLIISTLLLAFFKMDAFSAKQNQPPAIKEDLKVQRKFNTDFQNQYQTREFDYSEKSSGTEQIYPTNFTGKWLKYLPAIFKVATYIALIIALYFLIKTWLKRKSNMKLFGTQKEQLQYDEEELLSPNTDFGAMIRTAENRGDYRSAIRYRYLQILMMLNGNGLIKYTKDKTNTDYQVEMMRSTISDAFNQISYIYTYAWYGGFEVTSDDYKTAVSLFDDVKNVSLS